MNAAEVIQLTEPHLRLVENTPTTNQQGNKAMDMGVRLRWAWSQKTGRSTAKMVLIALTEHAGEDLTAYPSIARICELTEANRKTVINSLSHLQMIGLISDTGKRKGGTGQIIVYKVNIKESLNRDSYPSETIPKAEQLEPENKPKSTDFTRKESQKRDTEPYLNPLKDITPLTPQGVSDSDSIPDQQKKKPIKIEKISLDEFDIEGLPMAMPLQKHWLQDQRIKDSFKSVLAEYGVTATPAIWKLVAEPFANHFTEKPVRKLNWIAAFTLWARQSADQNAWRWKKQQAADGVEQAAPEKIEYYKAPPKASKETSEKFADSLKELLK